ncbi:MAG: Spy/CpxP family protein refolding chaperone [Pseudomonadota bacterium]
MQKLFVVLSLMIIALGVGQQVQSYDKGQKGNRLIEKILTEIELTDDQKTQLQTLADEANSQSADLDRSEKRANRKAQRAAIMEILTPEQQEQLKALKKNRKGKKDEAL